MLTRQYYKLGTIGLVFAVISITHAAQKEQTSPGWKLFEKTEVDDYWRGQVREAVDGAGRQLKKNFIVVLTELGRDSLKTSRTIKFHIASVDVSETLLKAIVNSTFDFSTLIVSTPKILTETLPNQVVSILHRLQENTTGELNSTISSLIDSIREVEKNGLIHNFFLPATNIVPNLLMGVNRFLVSILTGFFFLIGAKDPASYDTALLERYIFGIDKDLGL